MAVESKVTVGFSVTELGARAWDELEKFTVTTVADRKFFNMVEQAVADTDEALDVGDVSTIDLIVIKAITNDMTIDTTFVSTYNAELNVPAGELAVFKPSGTVYIKNEDSAEQVTYEYLVIGR